MNDRQLKFLNSRILMRRRKLKKSLKELSITFSKALRIHQAEIVERDDMIEKTWNTLQPIIDKARYDQHGHWMILLSPQEMKAIQELTHESECLGGYWEAEPVGKS